MRAKSNRWILALLLLAVFGVPHRAAAQGAETVIEWNRAVLTTLATPGATDPTVFFTRPISVVHVAIFEALNSINRVYTPYVDFVDASSDASPDAAAAQAAHDVLVAMYPAQQPIYDALLATQLGRLAAGAAASGSRLGAAAARSILAARASDGWNRPQPSYRLPSLPGYWQPVPPQNASATFGLSRRHPVRARQRPAVRLRDATRVDERAIRRGF